MDSRIQDRIRTLVSSGIVALPEVKRNLEHFVLNDLFNGVSEVPMKNNSSFWPSNKSILNAIYRASRYVLYVT